MHKKAATSYVKLVTGFQFCIEIKKVCFRKWKKRASKIQ